MRIVWRLVSAFLLLALCSTAFADGSGADFTSQHMGLAVAPNDQSIYYLGLLFGQVGTVLNGGGSQVLGVMFGEFNRAVMVLGVIVFTYVYGKGVLDTAAHGEFLGKQTNSVWVPIRSVAGIALMIPKAATGYCVIQVFLMWVVIQGVGAADMIWGKAYTYLKVNGTSGYSSSNDASAEDVMQVSTISTVKQSLSGVFQNLTAMAWVRAYNNYQGTVAFTPFDNWTSTQVGSSMPNASSTYAGYDLTYTPPKSSTPISFGKVYWQTNDGICAQNPDGTPGVSGACQARLSAQKDAVYNILMTYKPIAFYYVNSVLQTVPKSTTPPTFAQRLDPHPTPADSSAYPANTQTPAGQGVYSFAGENFSSVATNMYIRSLSTTMEQFRADSKPISTDEPVNNGWLYAGAYYYTLVSQTTNEGGRALPGFNASVVSYTDTYHDAVNGAWQSAGSPQDNAKNFIEYVANKGSGATGGGVDNSGSKKLAAAFTTGASIEAILVGVLIGTGAGTLNAAAISLGIAVGVIVTSFVVGMDVIILNTANIAVPMLTLSVIGHIILWVVFGAWIAIVIATFYSTLGTQVMSCMQPIGWAEAKADTYVSSAAFFFLFAMLSVGAFLAVYLPLVPFVYFLFGVINWLIAVLETMIAGPIVALGIMHPEGSDVWGKAEPAVMLTANIFLRPALMLFGLIAGTLLSFIGIEILTNGYWLAIENGPMGIGALFDPIGFILFFIFYVMLVVIIIQQSFKLIVEIPNRILQWLGSQGQLGGNAEEGMQQAKQQFGQASQQVEQAAKGSENTLREKARQQAKREEKDKLKLQTGGPAQPGTPPQNPTEGPAQTPP